MRNYRLIKMVVFVISVICAVCSYDYNYCEGTPSEDNIPEETTEETSTEEKVEEAMGPLTPDGNQTIVDDYGSLEAGGGIYEKDWCG